MPPLLIPRVLIVLVASLSAALSLLVTSQASPYAASILVSGVGLILALGAGIRLIRRAAFAYAGWSVLATLWGVAQYLGVLDSPVSSGADAWVFDVAALMTWIIWLSLIGVVVGLVVGVVLPRSVPRPPAWAGRADASSGGGAGRAPE